MTNYNRIQGCLLGLAVGDALGCTLEFKKPGTFEPITTIVGGGVHKLEAGQWTDDTSLALCLAQSLIDCKGFDAKDQMQKYCKWDEEGYMSSTGECFDIGNTTLKALNKFRATGEPYTGMTEDSSAGNGSIMRLAPIPMYYYQKPEEALKYASLSSKTTHANEMCVDACRYMTGIDVAASKLSPIYAAASGLVVFSDWTMDYGYLIIITHGDDYITMYGHNEENLVEAPSRVERGQLIALLGETGDTTGPHLHFEIWKNGVPVDPVGFIVQFQDIDIKGVSSDG